MKTQFQYDIFVSYAKENRDVATEIAEFLSSNGFSVWFDDWKIDPGDDINKTRDVGMKASRRIVVCISEHHSCSNIFEDRQLHSRTDLVAHRNLIPVRLDDIKVPQSWGDLKIIDWRKDPQKLQRLLGACSRDVNRPVRPSSAIRRQARPQGSGRLFRKLAGLDRLKHRGGELPIVLLGGIYLDLHVRPIATAVLTGDEYSHLQPIHTQLGGSAVQVGQDLKTMYGKTSHLVSIISGIEADVLARQCRDLLLKEDWIIEPDLIRRGTLPPATTLILHQSNNTFNTMFTHTGVLAELTWDMVRDSVKASLSAGGILYLSGFFKSKLWVRLHENLTTLTSSLVVIDHGRLMPTLDNQAAILTLADAFKQKLIDVYICTSRELWDLVSIVDSVQWEPQDDTKTALEAIARRDILPYITFVRSRRVMTDNQSETYEAYCIVGEEVTELRPSSYRNNSGASARPGAVVKNIFNAAILNTLAAGRSGTSIYERFVGAGQTALQESQALAWSPRQHI